jgi:hypothetical protein
MVQMRPRSLEIGDAEHWVQFDRVDLATEALRRDQVA